MDAFDPGTVHVTDHIHSYMFTHTHTSLKLRKPLGLPARFTNLFQRGGSSSHHNQETAAGAVLAHTTTGISNVPLRLLCSVLRTIRPNKVASLPTGWFLVITP